MWIIGLNLLSVSLEGRHVSWGLSYMKEPQLVSVPHPNPIQNHVIVAGPANLMSANAQLQLLLENSKLKKRHNHVKKKLKVTGLGSPFNGKQLV